MQGPHMKGSLILVCPAAQSMGKNGDWSETKSKVVKTKVGDLRSGPSSAAPVKPA